jgi:hypothetical protein
MATVFDLAQQVSKLNLDQLMAERSNPNSQVPEWLILGEIDRKANQMNAMQGAQAQQGLQANQPTVADEILASGERAAGLDAIPVQDDYFMSPEAAFASGGIIAFANGGVPSYQNKGIVRNPVAERKPNLGGVPLWEDIGGGAGLDPNDPAAFMAPTPVPAPPKQDTSNMTLKQLQDYNRRTVEERPGLAQVKDERDVAESKAKKDADTKAAVDRAKGDPSLSPKDEKRVTKAEDEYEKALKELLKKTDMTEEDKREALGFALMKFGAKAMAGKSQYAMQNIGEAVESGVDDYVSRLNAAKKDKTELTKTLAEYGLTKQKIAATRENTAEQAAGRREIAEMRRMDSLRDDYLASVEAQKGVPFQVWLQKRGFGGPSSSVATPVGDRKPFNPRDFQ